MARFGLLGEKLGHSYSPQIHRLLAGYDYDLCPQPPEAVARFVREGGYDGLNVTIPYKKTVAALCDELSPIARRLGSVNTVVRRPDGTLFGDNTDYDGFVWMLRRGGLDPAGRKCLVLGSGGASVTVRAALADLGAAEVVTISRSGPDHYGNLDRHADAGLIVNTTPVGMYPDTDAAPLSLADFPALTGAADIVYNPARTRLLQQAEALGIPCAGGLAMLVAQALRSSELFQGKALDAGLIPVIERKLEQSMRNIVLIGMPGSGKTTVGQALAAATGRTLADADALVEKRAEKPIPAVFAEGGEALFRRYETEALRELGKESGLILSTGGGCVTREENYPLLRQNGTVFWLRRDPDRLPREGRPLSEGADLRAMYAAREPLYRRFADHVIDNNGPVEDTVARILEVLI